MNLVVSLPGEERGTIGRWRAAGGNRTVREVVGVRTAWALLGLPQVGRG